MVDECLRMIDVMNNNLLIMVNRVVNELMMVNLLVNNSYQGWLPMMVSVAQWLVIVDHGWQSS